MNKRDLNKRDLCATAVNKWGYKKQLGMVIEEASELIKAVSKVLRKDINPSQKATVAIADLAEEAADMEIMLTQIRVMISDEIIDIEKRRKLEKLAGLLDQNESQPPDTQVWVGKTYRHKVTKRTGLCVAASADDRTVKVKAPRVDGSGGSVITTWPWSYFVNYWELVEGGDGT